MKKIILAIILIYSSSLFAQDKEKAREAKKFLDAGIAFQKMSKHEEALKNFEQALLIVDHPKIKYFKGFSLFEIRKFKEAQTIFDEISGNKSVKKYQKEIEAKLRVISEALKPVPLSVKVTDEQPARVSVNGKFICSTPCETKLEPGEYAIAVEREGFEPAKKKIKLTALSSHVEEFTLKLIKGKIETVPVPAPVSVPPPVSVPETVISETIEKPGSTLAYTTLITGAALFAAGSGFMTKHFIDKSNLRQETKDREADTMSSTNAITGSILMAIGAATGITSIFLFPDNKDSSENTAFKIIPQINSISSFSGLQIFYKWK